MESFTGKVKQPILLGKFEVVDVNPLAIIIHIGNGVHIHIHPGDFPHATKPGDRLPLYTELEYALPQNPSI